MTGINPCTIGIFGMFNLKEVGLSIVPLKYFQFFEKMTEQRKSPKLMEYLSTHPLAATRLAYLEAEITKANCLI